MIFLDNASTTKVLENVVSEMSIVNREDYFNPSALYLSANKVKMKIENARKKIADSIKVLPEEIYFTSGATESNNWVLNKAFKNKKGNIVISSGEHASIFELSNTLKSSGIQVRFVKLNSDGRINLTDLMSNIDEQTSLVSIIHCSNETGSINDIKSITKSIKNFNERIIVHSDGVQAYCKTCNDVNGLGVDLYSISAHKLGGPKGTGALYVRKSLNISPLIFGGGQEKGMRSGTENVAGIVGFACASQEFLQKINHKMIEELYDYCTKKLLELGNVIINGDKNYCSHFIISASIAGIKSEILQHMLSDESVLIGLGSACASKKSGNRVLSEMGIDKKMVDGSIRISFGIDNNILEVKQAMQILEKYVNKLRGITIG